MARSVTGSVAAGARPEESEPEEFPLPVPVESEPLLPFEPFDPLELEDPFDEEESEPLP